MSLQQHGKLTEDPLRSLDHTDQVKIKYAQSPKLQTVHDLVERLHCVRSSKYRKHFACVNVHTT